MKTTKAKAARAGTAKQQTTSFRDCEGCQLAIHSEPDGRIWIYTDGAYFFCGKPATARRIAKALLAAAGGTP